MTLLSVWLLAGVQIYLGQELFHEIVCSVTGSIKHHTILVFARKCILHSGVVRICHGPSFQKSVMVHLLESHETEMTSSEMHFFFFSWANTSKQHVFVFAFVISFIFIMCLN